MQRQVAPRRHAPRGQHATSQMHDAQGSHASFQLQQQGARLLVICKKTDHIAWRCKTSQTHPQSALATRARNNLLGIEQEHVCA